MIRKLRLRRAHFQIQFDGVVTQGTEPASIVPALWIESNTGRDATATMKRRPPARPVVRQQAQRTNYGSAEFACTNACTKFTQGWSEGDRRPQSVWWPPLSQRGALAAVGGN